MLLYLFNKELILKKFVFLHNTQYIIIIQIIKMKKSQYFTFKFSFFFFFAYSKSDNNQLLTKNNTLQ